MKLPYIRYRKRLTLFLIKKKEKEKNQSYEGLQYFKLNWYNKKNFM